VRAREGGNRGEQGTSPRRGDPAPGRLARVNATHRRPLGTGPAASATSEPGAGTRRLPVELADPGALLVTPEPDTPERPTPARRPLGGGAS
jgi:hypothetical protein